MILRIFYSLLGFLVGCHFLWRNSHAACPGLSYEKFVTSRGELTSLVTSHWNSDPVGQLSKLL